ncbi:MAG: nucleoside phosphorylase [Dysgonamonadaceae bacterium]|jgi:uridine phosphorylase|nr:nucleoside phosphorylase [Dysgonamonadaceae bacterium]
MRVIPPDEFPINDDGSVFHLHLRPEHLADLVILVGDPDRVPVIAAYFDSKEFDIQSREFRTITGSYKGKRISVVSHGIGCDNLDIVITELDALANINLATRTVNTDFRQLTMVRIGTSGGLQQYCPVGSYVVSQISMGMDGLIYFYDQGAAICDNDMSDAFVKHTSWNPSLAKPYFVYADQQLVDRIGFDMVKGITCSASGFYGPQGRYVRLGLSDPQQNAKMESFSYNGLKITNYEMESSALAGFSSMMGHHAMTVCLIIAGRYSGDMNTNYKGSFDELITKVLDRI